MTNQQEIALKQIAEGYHLNCKKYSAYDSQNICSMNVYVNEQNADDNNVFVILNSIVGTTDDYQPISELIYNLIEPDGTIYDMITLFPKSELIEYSKKLTKIQYNG